MSAIDSPDVTSLVEQANRVPCIRIFADFADTIIWFRYPIAYSDAAVSKALATDMDEWETLYYGDVDEDYRPRSVESHAELMRSGAVLARRLSEEVGPGFEVEFGDELFRSAGDATNREAKAAFKLIAESQREKSVLVEPRVVTGDGGKWSINRKPR